MMFRAIVAAFVLSFTLPPGSLNGQAFRGAIQGAVTDSSGSTVAGADNFGRNAFTGPPFKQFDFSTAKNTRLWEKPSMQWRVDLFNVLNPNFSKPIRFFFATAALCAGTHAATVFNFDADSLGTATQFIDTASVNCQIATLKNHNSGNTTALRDDIGTGFSESWRRRCS